MAIEDDKTYGLTGKQLTELADKVKEAKESGGIPNKTLVPGTYKIRELRNELGNVFTLDTNPTGSIYICGDGGQEKLLLPTGGKNILVLVCGTGNETPVGIILYNNGGSGFCYYFMGYFFTYRRILTTHSVVDALTDTSASYPLSANQGKVLNEKKQDKLTAGDGIEISDDNVISATGGGGSVSYDGWFPSTLMSYNELVTAYTEHQIEQGHSWETEDDTRNYYLDFEVVGSSATVNQWGVTWLVDPSGWEISIDLTPEQVTTLSGTSYAQYGLGFIDVTYGKPWGTEDQFYIGVSNGWDMETGEDLWLYKKTYKISTGELLETIGDGKLDFTTGERFMPTDTSTYKYRLLRGSTVTDEAFEILKATVKTKATPWSFTNTTDTLSPLFYHAGDWLNNHAADFKPIYRLRFAMGQGWESFATTWNNIPQNKENAITLYDWMQIAGYRTGDYVCQNFKEAMRYRWMTRRKNGMEATGVLETTTLETPLFAVHYHYPTDGEPSDTDPTKYYHVVSATRELIGDGTYGNWNALWEYRVEFEDTTDAVKSKFIIEYDNSEDTPNQFTNPAEAAESSEELMKKFKVWREDL